MLSLQSDPKPRGGSVVQEPGASGPSDYQEGLKSLVSLGLKRLVSLCPLS